MQSKCSEYRFNMAQAPREASINPKNWEKKIHSTLLVFCFTIMRNLHCGQHL